MYKNVQMNQVEQNANRFLTALMNHIQERPDIEKLANLLEYEPTQIETDIEDLVTLITEYQQSIRK